MCPRTCSVVSDSAAPRTAAHQAPLSTGFPRQAYLQGVVISFSGGSSRPRNQTHASCDASLAGGFFSTEPATTCRTDNCREYSVAQGTLFGALRRPKREGNPQKREHVHVCG